jgi:hypothetical protein
MKSIILKHLNFIFALVLSTGLFSEVHGQLNGSYVATKVTYLTDDELPDDNILKYTYVKYTFTTPDQISIASEYQENGTPYNYVIQGNRLFIKTTAGSVMNTLKIMESDENKLVLISGSASGTLDDPKSIKYTLYNEKIIQQRMALTPDDIFSIRNNDTTFKAGQKIYAQFKGPSFLTYVYDELGKKNFGIKNAELVSTFIINSKGQPDSLRIIQGISPKVDAAYIKVFNAAKNMWIPAHNNDKPVKVLMSQNLKYLSIEQTMPSYFNSQKANSAYQEKDYELALYHYDRALEVKGDDIENLYRRGICKQMLGNLKGACMDWQQIHALGRNTADELLAKYCN